MNSNNASVVLLQCYILETIIDCSYLTGLWKFNHTKKELVRRVCTQLYVRYTKLNLLTSLYADYLCTSDYCLIWYNLSSALYHHFLQHPAIFGWSYVLHLKCHQLKGSLHEQIYAGTFTYHIHIHTV